MSMAGTETNGNPAKLSTTNGAQNQQTKTEGGKVFIQTLNPMTGRTIWKMQPEDYDYQQEVARAAFADMLQDSERVIRVFYPCFFPLGK